MGLNISLAAAIAGQVLREGIGPVNGRGERSQEDERVGRREVVIKRRA